MNLFQINKKFISLSSNQVNLPQTNKDSSDQIQINENLPHWRFKYSETNRQENYRLLHQLLGVIISTRKEVVNSFLSK